MYVCITTFVDLETDIKRGKKKLLELSNARASESKRKVKSHLYPSMMLVEYKHGKWIAFNILSYNKKWSIFLYKTKW